MALPRGIRNNNPLNIVRVPTNKWLGQHLYDYNDKRYDPKFEQFTELCYGYRAAFILLYNYGRFYGLRSIRELISNFAPHIENDTEAYIDTVSRMLGKNEDYIIDWNTLDPINLVSAMQVVECGVLYPADFYEIRRGFDMFKSKYMKGGVDNENNG